jgi:hypothetical protein
MINIHRLNTNNVGDLVCAPYLYFPDLFEGTLEITQWHAHHEPDKEVRLAWYDKIEGQKLVVGGGGLLECDFFQKSLDRIGSLPNKKVIWGAGHNGWQLKDWRCLKKKYEYDFTNFDLVGIRDHGYDYQWVPCVSCMSDLFDREYEVKHEVAFYLHGGWHDRLIDILPRSESAPILKNDVPFEEAVEFLASADLVVTDSFHGAYWNTLLGGRTVALPSTSKFYGMKHVVPLCDAQDWVRFSRLAVQYPEALQECRAATLNFKEKVINL